MPSIPQLRGVVSWINFMPALKENVLRAGIAFRKYYADNRRRVARRADPTRLEAEALSGSKGSQKPSMNQHSVHHSEPRRIPTLPST